MASHDASSRRKCEPVCEAGPTSGFERYTQEVYEWAYRLLGRHHDALDVVQDVFLKWDRQCAESAPEHPRGWLRRVTINQAIDLRRHRRPELRARRESEGADEMSCAEPGQAVRDRTAELQNRTDVAFEAIDRETLRDDVAAAMSRVTDLQRAVLVAKVYDEMTFAQIAVELDLAVSTVKTHYLRALRSVRDRLQPRWA